MKIKKISLQEMWKLYLLLKPAIEGRNTEEFLFDEIETILETISDEVLIASLHILYDNLEENLLGIQEVGLFLQGLRDNEFFGFVDFIKGLSNGSTKQQ